MRNLLERILLLSLVGSRRSTLRTWGNGGKVLGWITEKHADGGVLEVAVGWSACSDKDIVRVTIPDIAPESISSSLWPAGLAGSILLCSPSLRSVIKEKSILELGSGLGLTGLVAAAAAPTRKCVLTDKDDDTVHTLMETAKHNVGDAVAQRLEWRDDHKEAASDMDVVLGTDVAYYSYLLQPLMDTARSHLSRSEGLLYIVGAANRESQWDLYHNIKDGCYNQLTDQHEPPWKGKTSMLLYNLQVGTWQSENSKQQDEIISQEVPIAAILYSRSKDMVASIVGDNDYVATRDDEESQMKTF